MRDDESNPAGQPSDVMTDKPKRGRPSTGQARSRAQIQRDYRQRNKSNVTKNTVESLDENMALRAQVLQLMNELDDARTKARAEFELGEKARIKVRELEKQLAACSSLWSLSASPSTRYELQTLDQKGKGERWVAVGERFTYTRKASALKDLKYMKSEGDNGWRVLDRKTGQILTE